MSKKLLLLLITLITFTNVSYASFPVSETDNSEIQLTKPAPKLSDNAKIILLSLVSLIGVFLSIFMISEGVPSIFSFIIGLTAAASSSIYSLYLNFTTNIVFWDWRNYLALVFSLPILLFTLLVVSYSIG
ncbi:MAG: hypothetical protein HOH88_02275 [Flavobacteriales bacterium]|jgi:hypothetical protein|nr:hypothetical protein [Flavobacteriales bacterium]